MFREISDVCNVSSAKSPAYPRELELRTLKRRLDIQSSLIEDHSNAEQFEHQLSSIYEILNQCQTESKKEAILKVVSITFPNMNLQQSDVYASEGMIGDLIGKIKSFFAGSRATQVNVAGIAKCIPLLNNIIQEDVHRLKDRKKVRLPDPTLKTKVVKNFFSMEFILKEVEALGDIVANTKKLFNLALPTNEQELYTFITEVNAICKLNQPYVQALSFDKFGFEEKNVDIKEWTDHLKKNFYTSATLETLGYADPHKYDTYISIYGDMSKHFSIVDNLAVYYNASTAALMKAKEQNNGAASFMARGLNMVTKASLRYIGWTLMNNVQNNYPYVSAAFFMYYSLPIKDEE